MNQHFVRLAERVTYLAATWQHMVFWTVLVVGWLALGPSMHFSDSWQLLSNSPSTIAELYLGLFILIAENHSRASEDRIKELQQQHNLRMEELLASMKVLLLRVEGEVEEIEQDLSTP